MPFHLWFPIRLQLSSDWCLGALNMKLDAGATPKPSIRIQLLATGFTWVLARVYSFFKGS